MTKPKHGEEAAARTPALFSLHPTLFYMFSSLDSNFQFTSVPTKIGDHSQGSDGRRLSAMDQFKKRHEEKGFLYACFFMLCCCFSCHEACEHCLDCFCCCHE
uniref:Uncharacterized protein n=1 Tax=Avena sativa TaxID=4498 RepID=A0ACD5ZPI2_AVESA